MSTAAAFGPVWAIRAGIALAVVAGLVAAWLLLRELASAVARHRREISDVATRAHEAMKAEREREREVLDIIDVRTDALKDRIATLTSALDEHKSKLTEAEATLAEQASELAQRDELLEARQQTIDELRAQVARLENELAALHLSAVEQQAELLALPRRVDRTGGSEVKQA